MASLFFLISCSGGGGAAGPSLNADDRWDWMARERDKPLPVSGPDEAQAEQSLLPTAPSLSKKEIARLRAILGKADKEYFAIAASLDRDFRQKPRKKTDRQDLWRTIQLHLSRLINMQKGMRRAIRGLDHQSADADKALLDHGRVLLKKIDGRIERTEKYLDNSTPDK